jgi:tetratricopeptide (TPR) repeat protein
MQQQAPDLDMGTLLAALQGHSSSQQAFREATKANAFKLIKARFAATKDCSGDKHTARHAVDALSDSDKPLPLPPADLDNLGWVLMDHPSAPCTTGLDDLLPVMLQDLVMGSHHRGKFLTVELIKVIAVGDLEVILGVRDGAGGVERLKINTACIKMHKGQQWLQIGRWFIIQEPFLTQDEKKKINSPCIRIDHPSDLLDAHRLPDSLLERKSLHRVLIAVGKRSAQLSRESGNAAFVRGDLVTSHDCYTEGLNAIDEHPEQQDEAVTRDIYRKRAHIRLKLGRYEGAIADALASLSEDSASTNDKLNAQAYFRAASAHYHLKHFARALKLVQKQLELTPEAKDGKELLMRTKARLEEQNHGIYDVQAMKSSCATQPQVDAADYLTLTVIKPSASGHGRGLYAVKDLAPGDLILAETAFSCVMAGDETTANMWSVRRPDEIGRLTVGLWSSLGQGVGNNPIDAQRFLDLHGASGGVEATVSEIDDTSVVDTFLVHDIMARHAFPLVDVGSYKSEKRDGLAIFVRASYINHACIPNSVRISVGDLVMIHAAKDEEITLCYAESKAVEMPFKERLRDMQMGWGYQCPCRLCVAEAKCSPANHAKREELVKATLAITDARHIYNVNVV